MKQVLFVCQGNICRSPSAEAVFKKLVERAGLEKEISCDSAGTIAYHNGESADYRMKQAAAKRGYKLTSISRKFSSFNDFDRFDYIIGMDMVNVRDLKAMARNAEDKQKISLMTEYCTHSTHNSVPDPYYGGVSGFELVLDILEDACEGLLTQIRLEAKK